MILDFVARYAEPLGLTGAERRLVAELALTTPESLHSVLLAARAPLFAAAGLTEARREDLLDALWPLLPSAYRAFLSAPGAPDRAARGALCPAAAAPGRSVPEDWPGRGPAESLAGEAPVTALLDAALAADWPPRDQGNSPACVAFAACAALEAAGRVRGGERLSAAFLYSRMRARGSGAAGAELGATKLGDAKAVLEEEGIATEAEWPDDSNLLERPGDTVRSVAAEHRVPGIGHWDRAENAWPGSARAVLELLKAGRPVAVSLPEYMAPGHGPAVTNWRLPSARLGGEVPNPPPGWVRAPTGHAVCVLGFQPAEDEPLGGWFIFRNSLGLRFAQEAPDLARRRPDGTIRAPFVPDNGYGALSAAHVEAHLWELFAPPGAG